MKQVQSSRVVLEILLVALKSPTPGMILCKDVSALDSLL